jgi:murein DD-endopeptidase MepM/ murein hydrolase activator NlpD
MSSLHQDRLLVEGSEPVTGTANALPTARGTSRRATGSTEKQATSPVPTQRLGTAQRTGTTQSTAASPAAPRAERVTGATAAAATGSLASRAKAATVKAATAKAATVKAATAKAATAKAATAKAATAKAATAARAAAVSTMANHTAGVRSARAAAAAKATPTAKARTAKPSPQPTAEATATKPVSEKAPAAKPAAKPVGEKASVVKPAAVKATTAKATAIEAPAAKPAAAKASPAAKPAAARPAPTAAKTAAATEVAAAKDAPATKPAAAKPSRATASTDGAAAAAPRVRPTPHKRGPAARAASVPLTDVTALVRADTADVVVVRKDLPADAEPPAGSRLPLFLRRRPPTVGRRPALYLAAALAGAISLSVFATAEPEAQATTVSRPVGVAEQLGIEAAATNAVVDADTTERLGELAASRNTRAAEQAAAIQVQAEADRIAAAAAAEAARPKAVLPVQGARLTSSFGPRWGTLHAGIDLAAPMHTPEFAVMDGVVLEAGPASGFGLAVYIRHENGDVTVYGHMDKILVAAGQVVKAGDTIALLGNRGQSTGPHLHFEVHVGGLNGQKIDPLPWLRTAGVDI